MSDMETMKQVHASLRFMLDTAFADGKRIMQLPGVSLDTVFAMGEMVGVASKAAALLGRDLDVMIAREAQQ